MKEGSDGLARGAVSDTVEKNENDMREKEEIIGEVVEDIEIVRQTLEELKYGGTSEGADDVRQNILAAESSAVEVFETEDEGLEEIHKESGEFADELQEREETVEADRERVSEATGRVRTQEALDMLARAQEAAEQDIDFLDKHLERANQAYEESEQAQSEYHNRVSGGRST